MPCSDYTTTDNTPELRERLNTQARLLCEATSKLYELCKLPDCSSELREWFLRHCAEDVNELKRELDNLSPTSLRKVRKLIDTLG